MIHGPVPDRAPDGTLNGDRGNLLTPVVRNAVALRTAARRAKRIAKIRKDVEFYQNLREVPSAAAAYVAGQVVRVVIAVTSARTTNASRRVSTARH